MKKYVSIIAAILGFSFAGFANAGPCGTDVIVELNEGGWNSDHLRIVLEYQSSDPTRQHQGTEFNGKWIVFNKNSLSAERMKNIRAIAYMAFVSGTVVRATTHTGVNLSEIGILNQNSQ